VFALARAKPWEHRTSGRPAGRRKLSGYLRAQAGRDPAGDQSCREFQNDAPGIFRGGTGRHCARPRRPPKGGWLRPHHIHTGGCRSRPAVIACVAASGEILRGWIRWGISPKFAVLGQLVSDGAHSILDPAGREICAFLSGPKDRLKITR